MKGRFLSKKARFLLMVLGVSMLGAAVVFGAAGALAWHYRTRILGVFAPVQQNAAAVPVVAPAPLATTEKVPVPAVTVAPTVPKVLSVTDVVALANKGVVSIEVSAPINTLDWGTGTISSATRVVGSGSGFFVSKDGLIVTNRHVVDFDGATYSVITSKGKRYTATVLGKDPVLDIAVLKVRGSGFSSLSLGDSSKLKAGQSVVAIGYALGQFQNSVSAGVISGLSRSIVAGDGQGNQETLSHVIQTDAAINPGNSGGPLLDMNGDVIGVNVAMAQGSQNIGFAIPINVVKGPIASVRKVGTIVRPYAGIHYIPIDAALASARNLKSDYGALVANGDPTSSDNPVVPDSPAARSGVVAGDIILSVDGTKLSGDANFASVIRTKAVGSTVRLRILRADGSTVTIPVILATAPNN